MTIFDVAEGLDLVATLASRGNDVWVRANGTVDGVELRAAGDDATRTLRGRFTLVSLEGRATGPLTATLARTTDTGLEVVAGVVVRARSAGVTVFLPTGDTASVDPRPAPPASWGDVADASQAAASDEEGEAEPEAGDLVEHFSFGVCEVLSSDGERLRIRDRKGEGRVREVSLDVLTVLPPTTSSGKRLFRLVRKT